jgi:plasmid stability protein
MSAMGVVRMLLAAVSVVAIAWFVLSARQARDISQATAIVQGSSVSAAQGRQVNQILDSAATLNPDREVMLLRAALNIDRNDNARARVILERVLQSEPENIVAWDLLLQAAGHDIQLQANAFRHIARLEPTVPHSH